MTKWESRCAAWLHAHRNTIAVLVLLAASAAVRRMLFPFISEDATYFLLDWYDAIRDAGALRGLGQQVGDYNMLYQTCIALLTYLPIKPLFAYKLLSCVFDYLLAFAVYLLVRLALQDARRPVGYLPAMCALFTLFLPTVLLDSACWAQCDSIYTSFALLSLYFLLRDKPLPGFVLFGVAFSFKLQAVFLLPFLLFLYLCRRKFSIAHFLLIPAAMLATVLPNLLQGRKISDLWTIYTDQTDTYKSIAFNCNSFWRLLINTDYDELYEFLKLPLVMVALLVVCVLYWALLRRRAQFSVAELLGIAMMTVYSVVYFLPGMHERYDFMYCILAVVVLFLDKSTLAAFVLMLIGSIDNYTNFLFVRSSNLISADLVAVLVYAWYLKHLIAPLAKKPHAKNLAQTP